MNTKKEGEKRTKTPWPTERVMEQIYTQNLWGGTTGEFYSGIGSHDPDIIQPYIEVVTSFLQAFKSPITVCDLGCGDFNIGKELVPYTKHYNAVDIAPSLIARNKELFQGENLEFHCLDIAKEELPFGDCALLRQVLQHLSNAEIQRILPKLTNFNYVVLTEHIPAGDFEPNTDIISGQGTRLKKQSGLDLLSPPFNLKVKDKKQLLSINVNNGKEIIVTTLYQWKTFP